MRFFADELRSSSARSRASALDSTSEVGKTRRRLLAKALKMKEADGRGGQRQIWPASAIKAAILGAKVNEARCLSEGRTTYTDLTSIARNAKNLTNNLKDLLKPSSVMPKARREAELDEIKEIASSSEGLEKLRKHAEELIQRIEEGRPYRTTRQARNANHRCVNGAFAEGRREGLLKMLYEGTFTPAQAVTLGEQQHIQIDPNEAQQAWEQGQQERAQRITSPTTPDSNGDDLEQRPDESDEDYFIRMGWR